MIKLVFVLLLATTAHAVPSVLIVNQAAIPHAIIDPAIAFVAQQFPIKIDFVYRRQPRKCRVKAWPDTYLSAFACYWRERLNINHDGPVVFITKSFSVSGKESIGGIGSVCDTQGVGVVFFAPKSIKFEGKLGTAIAHEVGHLFGAEHDNQLNPVTFMHAAALGFDPQSYSTRSKREIMKCTES